MALIDDLLFETERRGIIFHKDTSMPDATQLGYDGDPNAAVEANSDGEFLLYHSPSGTSFIQKDTTPFTKWNKVSDDAGGLWVIAGSGSSTGTVVGYETTFVNTDLTAGEVTFTHNLNVKYNIVHVSVRDQNNKEVAPDDIVFIDGAHTSIDLAAFAPISGTWAILITGLPDIPIPPIVLPDGSHSLNAGGLNAFGLN